MNTCGGIRRRPSGAGFEESKSLASRRGPARDVLDHRPAKDALAMDNLEGGGRIAAGMDAGKAGGARMAGAGGEAARAFDAGAASELVDERADPHVRIGRRKLAGNGRLFAAASVPELGREPTACKRGLGTGGRMLLERGRLHRRPGGRAGITPPRPSHDLREAMGLAVLKRCADWRNNALAPLAGAALRAHFGMEATAF